MEHKIWDFSTNGWRWNGFVTTSRTLEVIPPESHSSDSQLEEHQWTHIPMPGLRTQLLLVSFPNRGQFSAGDFPTLRPLRSKAGMP